MSNAKAPDAASIAPVMENKLLTGGPSDVVVEIKAAGVNPSDVKAATGLMPYAVLPRTPDRDFAGIVIDGPARVARKRPCSAPPATSASAATGPMPRIWSSRRQRSSRNRRGFQWMRPPASASPS